MIFAMAAATAELSRQIESAGEAAYGSGADRGKRKEAKAGAEGDKPTNQRIQDDWPIRSSQKLCLAKQCE